MKAITFKQTGGIENLKMEDVAVPDIKANEVLIQTKAIGINQIDTFVRKRPELVPIFLSPAPGQDTFILGWDISGVVTATGAHVTQFKKGDEVFGLVNFKGQGNAYAEYVAAPAGHLALKPANISHEEAAAATLAALTAWQSLVHVAQLQKGEKILIHAAGGGVGHYAVQIAKWLGAYVVANVSTSKIEFVKQLGTDEVIDHTQLKFEEKITNADVVLDPIVGDHVLRSMDALKKGGRLVALMSFLNEPAITDKIKEKGITALRHDVASSGEDMQQIANLLAGEQLRSHIAARFAFADLPQAHKAVEDGSTTGKIVVTI
jgi:NADPH:quinone reductase and related Zn-dependent oxidoreductases